MGNRCHMGDAFQGVPDRILNGDKYLNQETSL